METPGRDAVEVRSLSALRTWVRANSARGPGELVDVLQRDQHERWERGERVPAEAYLQILAEAGSQLAEDEHAIDLIYSEMLLRRESGEDPTPAEYFERFPAHAERLRLLLELHERIWSEDPGPTQPILKAEASGRRSGLPSVRGYELQEEIGRGGMGVVYKAWHVALNRTVAVKVVPTAAVDTWRRFRTEVEAMSSLHHPNIVQIFDTGETDDEIPCPYMTLEFVEGGNLARQVADRPLPPARAAELVETIARAVHFAHQRGILHRDLKPANILLGPAGAESKPHDAKVSDFGLAKRLDSDDRQTRTDAMLGTPGYIAPEQIAGRKGDIGTPADVYSLGAILYECLTGQPPFRAATAMETLEQVRTREPASPRRLQPGIPRSLETICLTCLRKEPDRRYASAAALADDLARFQAGLPIHARRIGPLGRAALWSRRNPALALAVIVGVFAVAAVAAAGVIGVIHERDAARIERDSARANLYRALVGETRALMKSRETAWWWRAMDNIRDASVLDVPERDRTALRDLAIELMGAEDPCFRMDATWSGHAAPVTAVAVHPNGNIAASGSRDRTVRLWSIPDGRPLAVLTSHAHTVSSVAFSPDGRLLASASANAVQLWDATSTTPAPLRTMDSQAGAVAQVAFAPDGALLAAACADGTVRLFSTSDGAPAIVLKGHTGPVACVAFSESGELASGARDNTIRFWHVGSGRQTRIWTVGNPPSSLEFSRRPDATHLAWSDVAGPSMLARHLELNVAAAMANGHFSAVTQVRFWSGNLWITASADGVIKLWRHTSTRMTEIAIARGEAGPVNAFALVPGGANAVAGCGDGTVRFWRIGVPPQRAWVGSYSHNAVFVRGRGLVDAERFTDLSTGFPGTWRRYTPSAVRAMSMDRAGTMLALGRDDGSLETWQWPERRESARWKGHERTIRGLAAGPDGRFASASADGTVKLWRRGDNVPERTLEPGIGPLQSVAWSGNGRHLAACGEFGVVLWDLNPGGSTKRVSDRVLNVGQVAFGAGRLVYSDADGTIALYDVPTGRTLHLRGHTAPVSALVISADGVRVASGANDNSLRVWDAATGRETDKYAADLYGMSLAIDRTGRYLLGAFNGPNLFDLTGKHAAAELHGVRKVPTAATFSPDGSEVFLAGDDGGVRTCSMAEIARARAAAGNPTASVRVDLSASFVPGGHTHGVWGITASPDDRWVATAGHDGSVKQWDAAAGLGLVRTMREHQDIAWSVAFSPDSRRLASSSSDIRIQDTETGQAIARIPVGDKLIAALAFHPQRPWLASGGYDGMVRFWGTDRWESLGAPHAFEGRVHDLAFRPDGRRLAVASDDFRVAVWDVGETPPSGPPTRFLPGHTAGVRSAAFSPDGRMLATGSDQGVVMLWDGESGERLATFRAGTGQIRGLSFTKDGEWLAAAGYGVPTIVWDVAAIQRTLRDLNLDW